MPKLKACLAYFNSLRSFSASFIELSIKENNRNGLYDSLIGENFINGEGFFFVPSSINKNVNSASQILEFNGTSFLSKGLFHSDSLHNTSLENQ